MRTPSLRPGEPETHRHTGLRRRLRCGLGAVVVLGTLMLTAAVPAGSLPDALQGPLEPSAIAGASAEPAAVPAPTSTQAVVTVKVGGDRTGTNTTAPVQGVRLALYTSLSAADPVNQEWALCTSDAEGDCSFVIPNTGNGGNNRDREYYVKAYDAPAGWRVQAQYGTGTTSGYSQSAYGFRVGGRTGNNWNTTPGGWQLRGGTTYTSTGGQGHFMQSAGNVGNASGGWFQVLRDNPSFPAKCGLDVALILDLSGSVAGSQDQLARAATALVDGLTGTPSAVSMFSFSTDSPATRWGTGNTNSVLLENRPALQQVSTQAGANTVKNWYATNSSGTTANFTPSGGTNWDRGIYAAAESGNDYDMAIVLTDGNPTFYGTPYAGNGSTTRFREVENGVFSANALKAKGTRVVAMGVGSGVNSEAAGLNLQALSGTAEDSDYYQTDDYSAAAAALNAMASASCEGTVNIVKEVVPEGTDGEDVSGSQPAGGWVFDAESSHAAVQVYPSGTTADNTGAVSFPLTFATAGSSADLTFAERQQSGYTLVTQDGRNAVCRTLDTGEAVTVENVGDTGFRIRGVDSDHSVSCTVYNRKLTDTKLTLVKEVERDFAPADAEGAEPGDWSLTATEADGDAVEEFRTGDSKTLEPGAYEIGEESKPGFELESVVCSVDGGAEEELDLTGDAGRVALEPGTSTVCTLTNRDLPGSLSWLKADAASGGPLAGTSWELARQDNDPESIEVTDNTGAQGQTTRDRNADAGRFEVTDLKWGTYSLEELSAPQGYRVPADLSATDIVIGPEGLEIELETITNELVLGLQKYGYERGLSEPTPIGGSEFAIYPDEGGVPASEPLDGAVTAADREDGAFDVRDIGLGTYWLVETKAPVGHSLLAEPVRFTVAQDEDGAIILTVDAETSGGLVTADTDTLTIAVHDRRAVELPIAGGTGAMAFLAAGILLLVLAAAWTLLIHRRRGSDANSAKGAA